MADNKSVEANGFVAKLKANGTEKDISELEEVYEEFKAISSDLPPKDRGTFSLNVLCILCRNLEKIQSWREKICNKSLLELSIDCLRQTRILDMSEQVKTLACVYYIHKYLVRQNTSVPPTSMLKLSYMPFEVTKDHILKDYCKTYWSILADRFVYIEKLKSNCSSITKLLPKLTEDITTVICIYNPVQFCATIVPFIVKKLHFLYSNICAKDLSGIYRNIFECIATKDNLRLFKDISEKEAFDLYVKFNECLYVIIENDSRNNFKDSVIDCVVRKMISILGHKSDLFHCFQSVYLNCFTHIFKGKASSDYIETVLQSLHASCVTAENLSYKKAMYAIYPFVSQLLRLFIEYNITYSNTRKWVEYFDEGAQVNCLKIILVLIDKLDKTQQISKCDNCNAVTGLHDALRLTFLTKNIITISINQEIDISQVFPFFFTIVEKQYAILKDLYKLNCLNYEKYHRKLQIDVHNTAITLNKSQHYQFSIKLFTIYLQTEIRTIKSDAELKNIARALYNKSICELDCKLYDKAITDAYLSLVFSGPEGLTVDKYMSLIMDIKAKALKLKDGDSEEHGSQDSFQLMTVLTACKTLVESGDYMHLKPFFSTLKFSGLLKHEFSMYVKLWPSIVPIAGVWMSLNELMNGYHASWLNVEKEEILRWVLYEVIMETPTRVRSIGCDHYKTVIADLLQKFSETPAKKLEERIVQATLLFMQTEFDLADAAQKYGWKPTESTLNPDQIKELRTLPQEQPALRCAMQAVVIWSEILPKLNTVAVSPLLQNSLQVAEVLVQELVFMRRHTHGLQLAHVCCQLARHVGDKRAYLRNAGTILLHACKRCEEIERMVTLAVEYWRELVISKVDLEPSLVFACELAIYYERCGSKVTGAKLLQFVQARLLETLEGQTDVNLELALGRLVEAEAQRSEEASPGTLSRVNAVQRHYVALTNTETKWTGRRHRALCLKRAICEGTVLAGRVSRELRLWRRARSTVGAALPTASALYAASMYAIYVDTNSKDAQTVIDYRLKHILGLQPTNEIQPYCDRAETKLEPLTPKHTQLETMLKCATFKRVQVSPSSPPVTPAFKMPEFLTHDERCSCYACEAPYTFVLALQTCVLEASMFYRCKEFEIARNYFDGASGALTLCEARVNKAMAITSKKFQNYILDIVKDGLCKEIRTIEAEMLIEESFFEMSRNNHAIVNDKIVRLQEMKESNPSPYLNNEVDNLLIATARLRKVVKKREEVALDIETEHLKLSPSTELVKTPESRKYVPVKTTNKVVKRHELPSLSYKISKLDLDGADFDDKEQTREVKRQFKVPVPITTRPMLETITPRPKTRVKVLVTQATDVSTPSSTATEFFTPCSSTPGEQFFTPMTSLKTYTRKRSAIVKNLDSEFSTPKAEDEKENKELRRTSRLQKKRNPR